MLLGEHSAILSTFFKLPCAIKICVLSIFEWPFYTGFTMYDESKRTRGCKMTVWPLSALYVASLKNMVGSGI